MCCFHFSFSVKLQKYFLHGSLNGLNTIQRMMEENTFAHLCSVSLGILNCLLAFLIEIPSSCTILTAASESSFE